MKWRHWGRRVRTRVNIQPLQRPGLELLVASHLGRLSKVSLLSSRPMQQRSRSLPSFIVRSPSFIVPSNSVQVPSTSLSVPKSFVRVPHSSLPVPLQFPSVPRLPRQQTSATSRLNVVPYCLSGLLDYL
jgi:hypothetical protein